MDDPVRRLRSRARQLAQGKVPRAIRYPTEFREAVVAFVRPRLGQGLSIERLARELGLTGPTLTQWCRSRPRPGLRPVALTPEPAPAAHSAGGPVLITRQGHRVEGLDLGALVVVLRDLT